MGVLSDGTAVFTCTVFGQTGTPTVTWWKGTDAVTAGVYKI